MKTLVSLLFSLLCFTGFSQELELDFAHRYGVIQDGLRHSVEFLEYFEEYNTWVVAGRFQSQVRVGINSTESLTSEDETQLGFVAMYNDDWDLLNSFKTGGEVLHADLTETDIIISGSFIGVADFDFDSDENELYESQSTFGNGYVASYSLSGEFNWVNPFYCDDIRSAGEICFIHNGNVNLILDYTGSQSGDTLFFNQDDLNLELTSNAGNSIILFQFNINGAYEYHHHFLSQDASVFMRNFLITEDKLYLSFNVTGGNFNAGIIEDHFFNNEFIFNTLVCAYDLTSFQLEEFYSFNAQNDSSRATGVYINKDENNRLFFTGRMTGLIELENHLSNVTQTIEFDYDMGEIIIFEYDFLEGLIEFNSFTSNQGISIGSSKKLTNGDMILAISFRNDLFLNEDLVEQTDENETTYALVYVNQEFNGAQVFQYSTGDDQIGRRVLSSSNEGMIVVGGSFGGEHDMDFSDDLYLSLGDVNDDQAGFIAEYTFDPTMSIKEENLEKLTIYPNPASDLLFFSENIENNSEVVIYTAEGKLVKTTTTANNSVDVSDLPNGQYSLVKNGTDATSFIISR